MLTTSGGLMRGRNLAGWNGCRKKRFRAAFWFNLTELIFTVIQMTGLRSCIRTLDTLYQRLCRGGRAHVRRGGKENSSWQTQSGVLLISFHILYINLVSMFCVSNCETEFCPEVAGVINSDSEFEMGILGTPQGDN